MTQKTLNGKTNSQLDSIDRIIIYSEIARIHNFHDMFESTPDPAYNKGGWVDSFLTNCSILECEPYIHAYNYNGKYKVFVSKFAYDIYGKRHENMISFHIDKNVPENQIEIARQYIHDGVNQFQREYNWKVLIKGWDKDQFYKDKKLTILSHIDETGTGTNVGDIL